jgi:ankyrin repeat protein
MAFLALCTTAGCTGHRPPSTASNQQLLKASEIGDLATVRRLLSEGASVDSKYQDGTTALMLAALNDRTEIVRLLLDKGANVSTRNIRGETSLSDAAEGAKAGTLKLLLDHGANPNIPYDDGRTILVTAAERGNSDAVGLFLANGFSLEQKNEALLAAAHGTPFAVMEVTSESNQTFKRRYSAKADPNSSYSRTIRFLLQSGAHIEARDGPENGSNTPLIVAATYGETDAVGELLENGANPEAVDRFGNTALMSAACICAIIDMPDTYESMKLLLEKHANPNAKNEVGRTALMDAVSWSRTDNMKLLLDHGAIIDARDNDGNTALMMAAAGGAIDLTPAARLLVERGADIKIRNKHGETARMIAKRGHLGDVVGLLAPK